MRERVKKKTPINAAVPLFSLFIYTIFLSFISKVFAELIKRNPTIKKGW